MAKSNRIALVTGAGGGIGRIVALALATDGWQVFVAGRRLPPLIATAELAKAGTVHPVVANVGDAASVEALFATIETTSGRLDLLFNNAGINVPKVPFDELAVEDLRAIVETNLLGSMLCARAAMGQMKRQSPQGGRIINNGSVSAYAPRLNTVPYTATKHAITGLTKAITLEGRPFNIACGQIDIGNAAIERTDYMAVGTAQADGSVASEPRLSADHVGEAVRFMAGLPLEANIPFITLMASGMPLYGRG